MIAFHAGAVGAGSPLIDTSDRFTLAGAGLEALGVILTIVGLWGTWSSNRRESDLFLGPLYARLRPMADAVRRLDRWWFRNAGPSIHKASAGGASVGVSRTTSWDVRRREWPATLEGQVDQLRDVVARLSEAHNQHEGRLSTVESNVAEDSRRLDGLAVSLRDEIDQTRTTLALDGLRQAVVGQVLVLLGFAVQVVASVVG